MTKAEAMLNHQQYSICVFGWSINCVDFVYFTDFVDFAAVSDKFRIDLQLAFQSLKALLVYSMTFIY